MKQKIKEFLITKLLPSFLLWVAIGTAFVIVPLVFIGMYEGAPLPKTIISLLTFRDFRVVFAAIVGVGVLTIIFRAIVEWIPFKNRSGDIDQIICAIHDEGIGLFLTIGSLTIVAALLTAMEKLDASGLKSQLPIGLYFWVASFIWFGTTCVKCKEKRANKLENIKDEEAKQKP